MEQESSALQAPVQDSMSPQASGTYAPAHNRCLRAAGHQRPHIRQAERRSIERILVPTDFSASSLKAVDLALALTLQWGTALTVLHVIDVNSGCATGAAEDLMRKLWEKAFEQMGRLASSFPREIEVHTSLEEGLPCEQIVEKSREADLIILPKNNGKPGWNLFSKRTVEAVVEEASCPVMLVCPGSS